MNKINKVMLLFVIGMFTYMIGSAWGVIEIVKHLSITEQMSYNFLFVMGGGLMAVITSAILYLKR
jgi:hypothetical protein